MTGETEKKILWNNFVAKHGPKSGAFLHSYEWGEFQEKLGRKIWRLKSENSAAQLIKMPLLFGKSYLYCPRGPIAAQELRITNKELGEEGILKEIVNLAKKENSLFIRLEPTFEFRVSGFKFQAARAVQPACTLILNLEKSEEKLLSEMHEKTRYNIRLAQKKGVKILISKDFEILWQLLSETAKRDNFRPHPKNYYETMLKENLVQMFIVEYNGKPLAGALVNFFNNAATYLHGASSSEERQVMAPHLLHWEIIKYAKSRGSQFYDWWGIDAPGWEGISRFKRGFGGEKICYPGAFDLPINKFWYKLYKLARIILRS